MTDQISTIEPLLGYEEVAELLTITPRSVFNLRRSGQLRALKIGKLVKFDPVDVRAFIEASKNANGKVVSEGGQ